MIFALPRFESTASPRAVAPRDRQARQPVTAAGNTGGMFKDSPPLDVQLLRAIAQGEPEALGILYDRYSNLLYSLAIRILNDPLEAEEVLQEVFLQIWQKAPFFDEPLGKPSSWVVIMTRNKAIDRIRARPTQFRAFKETANGDFVAGTEGENQPVENVAHDDARQIRSAVNALPGDHWRPIELAFFGGLTLIEIAGMQEVPVETVKGRIRHGLLGLRDGLKSQLDLKHQAG
jgi:RNA polymerase sigma-70 factor, ECF subfamily